MTAHSLRFVTSVLPGKKKRARKRVPLPTSVPEPTQEAVAERLSKLSTASMPWLSKDLDLSPPSGRPEQVGPDSYKGVHKRR